MSCLRTLPALLHLARPYQWTKNGFVLEIGRAHV